MLGFSDDLRGALRGLWAARGFVVLTVGTIALATGLTTGIFSVVNAVLLQPLPYDDPEGLVTVGKVWRGATAPIGVSEPELLDWRERARSFTRIEFSTLGAFALLGQSSSHWLNGASVSAGLFELLGLEPVLGRLFLPGEDTTGRHRVALISEPLWRTRFGADPAIIGTHLRLSPHAGVDTDTYEVVGVFRERVPLAYRHTVDIVVPHVLADLPRASGARRTAGLSAVARLKPGVSVEQASTEMRNLMTVLNHEYPMSIEGSTAMVRPLHEHLFGSTRWISMTLLTAVSVILLIATVNIASLLLTRARRRHHEMAVRLAIGSSRFRLVQQVLIECVLLAICGGIGGVLISVWVTRLFVRFAPAALPRVEEAGLDPAVFGFSGGVIVLCTLLSCLLPALRASRTAPSGALKRGAATGGSGSNRVRAAMIVAESALVIVLLSGAGLLVGSAWRLARLPLGFDARNVLTLQIILPPQWWWDHGRRPEFDRRVLERVRRLPGVEQASTSSDVPMSTGSSIGVRLEAVERPQMLFVTAADEQYLPLMKIPLLRGRPLSDRDTEHTPRVALVNRAFVQKYWPDRDPLGQTVTISDTHAVVGVVENVSELTDGTTRMRRGLVNTTAPAVYVPIRQAQWTRQVYVNVRTTGAPYRSAADVTRAIHAIDPGVTVRETSTLEALVGRATAETRFYAALLSLFGVVALVLAAVGVYTAVSQAVTERTREFGLRLAVGATPGQVLRMVLRQTAVALAIGAAIGLILAAPAVRVLTALLFGITATDRSTFAGVALLLTAAGLTAAWTPARRAATINPIEALRAE